MQDFKSVDKMLKAAEDEMENREQNLGTQYLNGVIGTLRWVLFGGEEPVEGGSDED